MITKFNVFINESIDVWHGSGKKFDKFDLDKIDTGAGNGYGWGFYFTDVKNSAKGYSEEEYPEVKIDNNMISSNSILNFIMSIIRTHGNKPEIILLILKSNAKQLLLDNKITEDEYNVIINAQEVKVKRNLNLYQVELHKNKTEYDYLSWDGKITEEQIKKIENQMRKEGYKGRLSIEGGKIYKDWGGRIEVIYGRDFYRGLAGDRDFTQKEASLFLLRSGIDGIKYSADGGYSYVVFDPNEITIKRRL